MPPTRSDRKRIVRDEEDLPANGSAQQQNAQLSGGTAMSRRGTSSSVSPKLQQQMSQVNMTQQQHQQQLQQQAMARSENPFNISQEQLMQQYQMLTDHQKSVLATYSQADQKKLLEQQVAKGIYEKMTPAEQAIARARAQQNQQMNRARGQANVPMGSRVFYFSETPEALLKKFENDPPSLILHIHPTHFGFGNQETVIPKNSPLMKTFLEYVAHKAIPPAATEVFGDSELRFYEGNIILQIVDHRAVPQEQSKGQQVNGTDNNTDKNNTKDKEIKQEMTNGSADKKPDPNSLNKEQPGANQSAVGSNDNNKNSNTQKSEPKIIRTILRPTPLSMWHDLLYTSDFQANPISDDVVLGVESEILKFTIRNIDLTVPRNPFNSPLAPILTNQKDVRERLRKEQGKRTWSEFEAEQLRLQDIHKKIKQEEETIIKKEDLPLGEPSLIPNIKNSLELATKNGESEKLSAEEESVTIKSLARKAEDSAFEEEDKIELARLQDSTLFDNTKEAVETLYKNRPEVNVAPRKLHEELMQHGSEYEELMLIMSDKSSKSGSNNASGQLVRLSFIEQIYKKNKTQQRFRQMRQAQAQAANGQAAGQIAAQNPTLGNGGNGNGSAGNNGNGNVGSGGMGNVANAAAGSNNNVQSMVAARANGRQNMAANAGQDTVNNNVSNQAGGENNNNNNNNNNMNNNNNNNTNSGNNNNNNNILTAAARPRTQQEILRQQQLQLQYQQIQAQYPHFTQVQTLELLRRRQVEQQQRQMEAIARAQQQQQASGVNQNKMQQGGMNSPNVAQNQLNDGGNMGGNGPNPRQGNKGVSGSPNGSISGTPIPTNSPLAGRNNVAGKTIPRGQGGGGNNNNNNNSNISGKTIPNRQNAMMNGNVGGNGNGGSMDMNGVNVGTPGSNMAQLNGGFQDANNDMSGFSFGNMNFNNNGAGGNGNVGGMNNLGMNINLNNLNGLNMGSLGGGNGGNQNNNNNGNNNSNGGNNNNAINMNLNANQNQNVGGKTVPGRTSGKTIPGTNAERQTAGKSLPGSGMGL